MLNQSFDAKNLKRLIRSSLIEKHNARGKAIELVDKADANPPDLRYVFTPLKSWLNHDKPIFSAQSFVDDLVLKKIADNIKRLYKIHPTNRHAIIRQIVALLSDGVPYRVVRLDIASFYESIERERALEKLRADGLLSIRSLTYLEELFRLPEVASTEGLPRGLTVSAALSELYMRDFDKRIRQMDSVYYYARYVDDIVLFTSTRHGNIVQEIASRLPPGLRFNELKQKLLLKLACRCELQCSCPGNCQCHVRCSCNTRPMRVNTFPFLGYSFTAKDLATRNWDRPVVRLADKKVKKIKTRIIRAILDHCSHPDFQLLQDRFKYLTGNYRVKGNAADITEMKAGIYYNYTEVNDPADFVGLDLFMRRAITARRGSFGRRVQGATTALQRQAILKYSFKKGFEHRRLVTFPLGRLELIKRCWSYEKN